MGIDGCSEHWLRPIARLQGPGWRSGAGTTAVARGTSPTSTRGSPSCCDTSPTSSRTPCPARHHCPRACSARAASQRSTSCRSLSGSEAGAVAVAGSVAAASAFLDGLDATFRAASSVAGTSLAAAPPRQPDVSGAASVSGAEAGAVPGAGSRRQSSTSSAVASDIRARHAPRRRAAQRARTRLARAPWWPATAPETKSGAVAGAGAGAVACACGHEPRRC